jgi:hypothetical protein
MAVQICHDGKILPPFGYVLFFHQSQSKNGRAPKTSQKKAKTYLWSFITFEKLTLERFQHHFTARTKDLDSKYGLCFQGPKNYFPNQVLTRGWTTKTGLGGFQTYHHPKLFFLTFF